MDGKEALESTHPTGEPAKCHPAGSVAGRSNAVDTFGGKVFVRGDPDAAVTALAPVTYFIEFLKTNGLWQK